MWLGSMQQETASFPTTLRQLAILFSVYEFDRDWAVRQVLLNQVTGTRTPYVA
jgi:hypothetical protein